MELGPLAGALVGSPGQSGLSVEARKRLTIGVELCANPSVIFMDEPTSGMGSPVTLPKVGHLYGLVLLLIQYSMDVRAWPADVLIHHSRILCNGQARGQGWVGTQGQGQGWGPGLVEGLG